MFLTHFARKNSGLIRHLQTRWLSSKIVKADGALVVKYSPAPGARLAPTPLVFVGSSQLEDDSGNFHLIGEGICSEAIKQGFSCFQFDIPFKQEESESAKAIMDRFSTRLRTLISTTDSPFPPILYAGQLGCLIAQTYVSSHPVSALILDSPPVSCESLLSWPGLSKRFPLPLPEFSFEPKFPVLVLERSSANSILKSSRLVLEGADYCVVNESKSDGSELSNKSRVVFQWIDELGY
ncbi:hypothetical protein PNOK_0758800 [Pyrrhoderma noxium]|uniref:Alpha beta-hydrolase n=1 Tax=Pyrrhoderma noxium TaxID=2282107 RepID=A0A286UD61_9AGAM|nr:hypothetical protein PNOK_0758800 [Pyrrhoderma noxium]